QGAMLEDILREPSQNLLHVLLQGRPVQRKWQSVQRHLRAHHLLHHWSGHIFHVVHSERVTPRYHTPPTNNTSPPRRSKVIDSQCIWSNASCFSFSLTIFSLLFVTYFDLLFFLIRLPNQW